MDGHTPENEKEETQSELSRRTFLQGIGLSAMAGLMAPLVPSVVESAVAATTEVSTPKSRREASRKMRIDCANQAFKKKLPKHKNNGAESAHPYVGSFSKGFPHNSLGEVSPKAYRLYLKAVDSGDIKEFERISLAGDRKLRNPQAALAFDLQGPDAAHVTCPRAPRMDEAEHSSEMAELYWMSLTRDIPFLWYSFDPTISSACADMSRYTRFTGPQVGGGVTVDTLFRGNTPGDLTGPFVSQFLLKDVPYGSLTISHKQTTSAPGVDYMTDLDSWLAIQNGANPKVTPTLFSEKRYIRNGRDLCHYVHVDALYEAYLNACLYLLSIGAPFDSGNPYRKFSKTDSFGTFGGPHILSLVCEVATRALKAAWYQKYNVHRRLRPEEFGGRIEHYMNGRADYPINGEIMASPALDLIKSKYGTYLLPQAFPEGSPMHPAYPSGHATVAGACVTILKAWFDESYVLPNPVEASADGTALVPYTGAALTVGGELNKVASNIATGRNMAGVHWRTDFSQGIRLGERVAIQILEEQRLSYPEKFRFALTTFDGHKISI